jgi:glycosyltransferase involved in cell wall biosynthesis
MERKLAVVIPAYNASATLPDCLAAIARSERKPDEIILFDDGSTDETADIARAAGAVVLRDGSPRQGPGIGRNIGATMTAAPIIVFVDADVAVHAQALGRLEAPILSGDAVACFGSYDDRPKSRRLGALYANLRHHWVHQQGRSEAFTFWSGLGAVASEAFRAHGGFDPRFNEPSIEDIDLGIRIIEGGGTIRLVKDALGTHHKDWGVVQLWKTDIFKRAIPWARLMIEGRGRANDLNISLKERAAAVCAHLVWIGGLVLVLKPHWWPALAAAASAYLVLNARFFVFLFRAGGWRAALAGVLLHWCYHVYASTTFALVVAGASWRQMRSRIMNARVGRTHATRP